MRSRGQEKLAGNRNDVLLLAMSVVGASTVGCGAYDAGGDGGAGGGLARMDAQGGGGATEQLPESMHDSRWDVPDSSEAVVHPPSNAVACTLNSQCSSGFCVDSFCCDTKCDYKCMACSAAKKGQGVDGVCGSIKYDMDPDNECPSGSCDGKNVCRSYNGAPCTSTAQCLSNYCVDGYCCGNICMGSCQACSAAKKGSGSNGVCGNMASGTDPDSECNPGECNGSGTCNSNPQPTYPNGTACTSAAQCASGYCADGVCCDSWCLGTCQACTSAKKGSGSDGTCGMIKYDTDPDEECWGGSCNGQAVCKQYNGVPCADKSQCLSGYCVDGYCCGNVCTGLCQACSAGKKGQGYDGVCGSIASTKDPENECNPGECNGAGACNQPQTPQANGTVCVSGGQCASGNCVEGYCCDTACTGLCQACSASKKGSGTNGTCGSIAAETDPDSECGYGGRCGGNGTCRYYNGITCNSTAQCFSNYCVDGVCCGNLCTSTCYACTAAKKAQGSDGSCGPIASSKDPDNECNPGECNGSGACNQPQAQPNGASCTLNTHCLSGLCVDGVCCNSACTGNCMACSATKMGQGTSGTCGFIATNQDPDDECASGACNGTGSCAAVCPAPGTPGSCGTAICPACPPLVVLATGTTGLRGTFISSSSPQWTTTTYSDEPSTDVPNMAALTASAEAVGLVRRTDDIVRWTRWTPAGFSAWNAPSGAPMTDPVVLAANSNAYAFVARHPDGEYWQGGLGAGSSSWSYGRVIKWMGPGNWWLLSGPLPPVVGYTANGVLFAETTGSSLVVWKDTGGYASATGFSTTTTRLPALATYFAGSHVRDALFVFQDNVPVTDQLYWAARQSGAWTSAAMIANAQATDQSLLALPNDDFMLVYRDPLAQLHGTRFSGATGTWSTPQPVPGNMTAMSKPSLALGAGDAEVELLFVESVTGNGYHARWFKDATNFTTPVAIPGATGLVGIAAATVLSPASQPTGTACAVDAGCASGHCVDGVCCETDCASTCMACSAIKKGSGVDGACEPIAAETNPDQECGSGGRCGGNGTCRYYNGFPCSSTAQCFSNYCVDGVCCGNVCTGTCYACTAAKKGQGVNGSCGPIANTQDPDNECNPGQCNGSGACNQAQSTQPNGSACTFAAQCASGYCADGVCCDSACLGTCKACSAAKKGSGVSGTCGNIIHGTDPDTECSDGACSGTGSCRFDNGLSCSTATQCLSSHCTDGVCCDDACDSTCRACSATKKGSGSDGACGFTASGTDPDDECALMCNAAGGCTKAPIGATCSSAADCVSGFCADGFCCNAVCNGACQTCGIPGQEGTCSNACAAPCSGTVGFSQAPMSPPSISGIQRLHSADVNADGILDLVGLTDETFVVSLGQGNGTFIPGAVQTLAPIWTYLQDSAMGDLNGDSKPDLVYCAENSFIGCAVLLNQGNGSFGSGTQQWYDSPGGYSNIGKVVLGDFDTNGTLDVGTSSFVADVFAGSVYRKYIHFKYQLNSGDGVQYTLSSQVIANYLDSGSGGMEIPIAGGDFNGDGKVDIAISHSAYDAMEIHFNQGNGTFSLATTLPWSSSHHVADLNGDGAVDITGVGTDGNFRVWLNDGTGAFEPGVAYPDVMGPVKAVDLNGDGSKDLVFRSTSTTVGVVVNQGNGTFGPRQDHTSPVPFYRLEVGDWDGDGRVDLALQGDSLAILLNTCVP